MRRLSSRGRNYSIRNEEDLDELMHALVGQIQLKMKTELKLREVFIPSSRAEAKCNIFVSTNIKSSEKLCVFMQPGKGMQPGIWSRTISSKTGFQGSMIPYLKTAMQRGFSVLIMNPSTNYGIVNGQRVKILHSSTPEEHVQCIWKNYIMATKAKQISFIVHDAAGALLKKLLGEMSSGDENRISGIAFIESAHQLNSSDSSRVRRLFAEKSVNFEASLEPMFKSINSSRARLGCISLSVGRTSGEVNNREWTVHSVQTSVFVFLQSIQNGIEEAIEAVRATFPNKLVVTVNRARLTGQPYHNPFAIVHCVGQKKETIGNHKHTMDPEWNQTFSFPVTNAESNLIVHVKDKTFPLSTSLGQIIIPITEVGLNRAERKWFTLRDEKNPSIHGNGEVELTLEWVHDTFVARSDSFVRTNGTASAPSNTSHSSFIPLQTPPTSTTANSTTTTNNNSTSTSTSTSGQNKNGNSNSRGTIEAEATNCYLCQTNFVLHRRRYCKMCLLAVCASCSDRLFLPGFSEAKRVCKGCSELQLLLHRKLPKGTIGTTGRKGITNDTTGTTGDGATTTTTNNNNTTTTSSSATTSAINTTGDGGTSITTTTTTTTTTTGGISSSTKMMASSKAFALQEAKRKMEEMRLRELKKNQSKKPLGIEDFDLLKVVGRGAFGKVLLVKKKNGKNAGNIYAMKILVKAHIIKNDQIENTKSEQHILKEINHPFIVRLRYAFQNTEKLYLVMDYYPGGSMFYHLRKSKKFTEERTRLYMAQLLTALMHLHSKQIAYRDLKLENILMDPKGNIALTDFGLSKEGQVIEGAIRASQADAGMKTICGTAEYMAPELLRHQPYGKVVDWWSYGILLFEMLTGRTPFVDRNRRQMFKNIMQAEVIYPNYISPVARSLISKLLNRDPSKRLGGGPNGGRDIMAHSFFDPIDWDKLARKEIKPTFIPKVTSVDDITNVPEMFQNMAAIDSPVNNKSTGEAHHFDDFSFQEETLLTRG